ncbi:MAG: nuclease domain-containing protein [bacterium]
MRLRPDISIVVPDGPNAGLHLLDAKFKLQKLDSTMKVEDDPEVEPEERQGTFKRADLYKMHAYRDAIPQARSVWVLYPGTQMRFFSVTGEITESPNELPSELKGVGAIPLTPSKYGHPALETFLRLLLGLELPSLRTCTWP